MAPSEPKKKSKGRQKIPIEFIKDDAARTTTFSKRKAGLFKKAAEFSHICGVKIAVILFSMCRRAYSFGHPSAEWVAAQRFGPPPERIAEKQFWSPAESSTSQGQVKELKEHWDGLEQDILASKKKVKELNEMVTNTEICDENIKRLSVSELVQLRQRLMTLRDQVQCKAKGQRLFVPSANDVVLSVGKNDGKVVSLAQVEMDQIDKSNWLKL